MVMLQAFVMHELDRLRKFDDGAFRAGCFAQGTQAGEATHRDEEFKPYLVRAVSYGPR